MRGIAAVVVLVLGAAVAGCGTDERGGPVVQGTLQRSTLFETQRALKLAMTGDNDHEVHIAAIQLHSPLFERVPPDDRDAVLRRGSSIVTVPLPFGDARCDAEASERAEVVAEVDGDEVEIEVAERPSDLLADLHAKECAAAEVREQVDLAFADRWEHTAPRTAATEVELAQRHDGITATVDELEGNAVFSLEVEGNPTPVLEVDDDHPSATVPVVVEVTRCDPHGITEYKRKYKFVAWVRLGDAEPVRLDLEAQGDGQRLLESLLAECLG